MRHSAGEPAVPPTGGPLSKGGRGAAVQLRLALLALAVACASLLLLLAAYELATARAPQHRAALEQLIRQQTGLEVRFAALALRWGWYGPEALFDEVELGQPESAGARLRAQRLIVSLDAWRMLRSGHLEARRITLESPVIDLLGEARALESPASRSSPQALSAAAGLLARWRGGEIDISRGTLRTVLPGRSEVVSFGIAQAELRRFDRDWSAEAQVVLPRALGTSAHLALQLRARADLSEISRATVSAQGHALEVAAWRTLLRLDDDPQVPRLGTAELQLQATFSQGHLQSASGRLAAQSLRWRPAPGTDSAPSLERLRGSWQLRRRATEWHLRLYALELEGGHGADDSTGASVNVDFTTDGLLVRGRARHLALAPLLPLVHAYVPDMLSGLVLRGEASEVSFDWNAHRGPGARLTASAELDDVALSNGAGDIELTGLSGQAMAQERSVLLTLHAASARLTRADAAPLENLAIDTHVNAAASRAGLWHLETQDLQVHGQGVNVTGSGALSLGTPSAEIDARLSIRDTDAALLTLLTSVLGSDAGAIFEQAPAELAGGRVESGELVWRGGHVHALIDRARAQGFALTHVRADWDSRAGHSLSFAGRVAGDAQRLIAWLRSHPQAALWAPGLEHLELRGNTLLDLELTVPETAAPRVRVTALLDGVQLQPLPGLPPLEALHGTLAFADGHLQRSSVTARWLDGPASLSVAERRQRGLNVLVVSGRGLIDARRAVQAAGGDVHEAGISGSADWSAVLTAVPGVESTHWELHADSTLAAIASQLAAPFDKPPGTVLPLHVDWETRGSIAQLRLALGERLAAVAALKRDGDTWRIDRGAVRLGNGMPALPIEPKVLLEGHLHQLDLAAALALWRQAAADAALPGLQGRVTATELLAGEHRFPEVVVTAESAGGAAALRFECATLSAVAAWPARVDRDHPALLHLTRFNVSQPDDAAVVMRVARALSPMAELVIDELQWQGNDLGSLSGRIAVRGSSLEASELALRRAEAQAHGIAQCLETDCKLNFSLDTGDPAGTLTALGLAPEVSARAGHLGGELSWPRGGPLSLATLAGSLHMQVEDGVMEPTAKPRGPSFPLLSVPALLSGLVPDPGDRAAVGLRFERFTADYELQAGEAHTSDLHFDGDAEILVRGLVGLTSGEYEQRAWILRGEDRLPAALRRLDPGPGVAALWLSLRDVFGSEAAGRSRTALRLRGLWSEPIVTPE